MGGGISLYATGRFEIGLILLGLITLNTRLSIGLRTSSTGIERSTRDVRCIGPSGMLYRGLPDDIPHSIRVLGANVHGDRVLLYNGVTLPIDRRIEPDIEDVLMVRGEDTWGDNVSVRTGLVWVDLASVSNQSGKGGENERKLWRESRLLAFRRVLRPLGRIDRLRGH